MCVPLLLSVLGLVLEPAQEGGVRIEAVTVTRRLQQLDLSDHLKFLQNKTEKGEKRERRKTARVRA